MQVERHGYATVILQEKLTISNASEFKETLQTLFDQGYKVVELDFRNLEIIDSTGLGKLLLLQKVLKEQGGELKIINLESDFVRKMFNFIQLHKTISIEENKE